MMALYLLGDGGEGGKRRRPDKSSEIRLVNMISGLGVRLPRQSRGELEVPGRPARPRRQDAALRLRRIGTDDDAALDDLREAVKTLEDIEPIARRVLGGAHPLTVQIGEHLRESRAALESAQAPDAVDAPS